VVKYQKAMNNTSKNTEQNSTPYLPKTEQEQAEAFKLLDELERELAKEEAFREVVAQKILEK
jgi:hypothetical protein